MIQLAKPKKINQFKSLLSLTKASFIGMIRNPSTIFFNFFFPFIFIVIFGSLSGDNIKFDIGVREKSMKEGLLYESFEKINTLNLITNENNDQLDEKLEKGRISTAITITPEQPEFNGMPIKYNIHIEKSSASPDEASTVASIIEKVVDSINETTQNGDLKIVSLSESNIEGRKFTQIDFILPGQLAFALLSNALFGMTFSLITLKK